MSHAAFPRVWTVSAALTAALGFGWTAGIAVAAETDDSGIVEEIVVTAKYQHSLADGISQKRDADNQIEAIGLEDIGVLPAKSIAEVIAAMPGIAGARSDQGTISQLSVRGTTDLTLGTLNGREQVTVATTRNVEYALYPPNVMSAVQVHKTAKANLSEGGLSGTINMNTIRPLSFDEREIVFNGEMSFPRISDDVIKANKQGGQGSVVYIDQFNDNFGIVLSYAYADEVLGQDGDVNPFDWRGFGGGFGAPPDVDGDGMSGDEVIPAGFNLANSGGSEVRNSAFVALQWQSDEFEMNFDLLASRREQDSRSNGMNFIGTTNSGGSLTNAAFNARGAFDEVASGTITVPGTNASGFGSGGSFSYNQLHDVEHDVLSTGLNLAWRRDQWTITGDIGHSRAESDFHLANTTTHLAPTGGFGGPTFTLTFDALRTNPTLAVAEDMLDATLWVPRQFEERQDGSDDELTTFKLDVERDLSDSGAGSFLTSVEFGVRYSDRKKDFAMVANRFNTAIVPDVDPTLMTPAPLDESFVDYIATPEHGPAFIVWDLFRIRDERFTANNPQQDTMNPTRSMNELLLESGGVEEETLSGYMQVNFSGHMGDLPFQGNLGLRLVNTESESPGWTTPDRNNVAATPINPDNDYFEALPSLNLAFEITDTQLLRLGVARVMNRAPLDDLKSSQQLYISGFGANGRAGNPMLDPTLAWQMSASWEWYPTEFSSLVAAGHWSELDSFVGTEYTTIVVVTADSVDGFGNVVPGGPIDVELETVGNGDGGYIRGLEFAVNTNFGFLSEPLESIGVSANYAFTESNVVPVGRPALGGGNVASEGAALTGLSEHVANLGIWWADYNIEARMGLDYRSKYIEPNVFGNFLNVDDTTLISFNLSYDFSEKFRVSLFGVNIGDEGRRKYTAGIPERTEFNQYYRETYGVRVFYRM